MDTLYFTNKEQLNATGERFTTELRGKIAEEHLHRYSLAMQHAKGRDVLDIACGEGYGTNLLGTVANHVIGVDIDNETVIHAKEKYSQEGLDFRLGSCQKIPVADCSIDLAISFETIEHIEEHDQFLNEIKRVLKPGGTLIISSPDKENYSDHANYNNPYHLKELYFDEFVNLTKKHFKHTAYAKQTHEKYSLITPSKSRHLDISGDFQDIKYQEMGSQSDYTLAYCSDHELENLESSTFSLTANTGNNQKCTVFVSNKPEFGQLKTSEIYYSSEGTCTLCFKDLHELMYLGTNYIRIDPSEKPGLMQLISINLIKDTKHSSAPEKLEVHSKKNLITLDQSINEPGWHIAINDDPQILLQPFSIKEGEKLDLSIELKHYENSKNLGDNTIKPKEKSLL